MEAYSSGVLSLDEFAEQKTRLEKQLKDLLQANAELKLELEPKLLRQEDMEDLESYARQIREGTNLAEAKPETQ